MLNRFWQATHLQYFGQDVAIASQRTHRPGASVVYPVDLIFVTCQGYTTSYGCGGAKMGSGHASQTGFSCHTRGPRGADLTVHRTRPATSPANDVQTMPGPSGSGRSGEERELNRCGSNCETLPPERSFPRQETENKGTTLRLRVQPTCLPPFAKNLAVPIHLT